MASRTLTLALDGDVSLKDFVAGIVSFQSLVDALTEEIDASHNVEWVIDDLQKSSAIATIRGESETPDKVDQVVKNFAKVGKALQSGEGMSFSKKVVDSANTLARILSGRITTVRLETADEDFTISNTMPPRHTNAVRDAYGAIEGRIQTLTNRKSLRFTLYDTLHDRAVSCYLKEGQESIIREAWGKRASVEGKITRDPLSGRPLVIREVSSIHMLPEEDRNGYKRAKGVSPAPAGSPPPEQIIRRLRDD